MQEEGPGWVTSVLAYALTRIQRVNRQFEGPPKLAHGPLDLIGMLEAFIVPCGCKRFRLNEGPVFMDRFLDDTTFYS